MRIVAGSARGKTIKAPKGMATRPTTEKVREAIFSVLGPYVEGALVLDAFAGSGALGLEALSRGAARVVFCEKARPAQQVIRENVAACGVAKQVSLYRGAAEEALRRWGAGSRGQDNDPNNNSEGNIFDYSYEPAEFGFDLVLLDPPYNKGHIAAIEPLLLQLGLLRPGAVVMLETARKSPELFSGDLWQLYKAKTYGDTAVYYYGLDI